MFRLDAPRLLIAHFSNALPAPSSSLQNLGKLQLDLTQGLSQTSFSRIVELLRVPKRLDKLSLRGASIAIAMPQPADGPIEILHLDYLTKFELVLQDAERACQLLESISAPRAMIFKVKVYNTPGDSLHTLSRSFIQPHLSHKTYDIVTITPSQLYLAESEERNGDSSANFNSAFVLYFPMVEASAYTDVLDVLAENSASIFKTICCCGLGPAQDNQ